MGVLALETVAGILFVCAVILGYVTIATRSMASHQAPCSHRELDEDLVRRSCANLDDEYRRLLNH